MPDVLVDNNSFVLSLSIGRCPACGIRVSPLGTGCKAHGPVLATHTQPLGSAGSLGEFPVIAGYQGIRWIGRGGFGVVLEARRDSDQGRVAIKIARCDESDAAPRLLRELQALKAIGKPTVPEVFAAGCLANGAPYIVMDLIHSKTLSAKLADQAGPIPLAVAMPFVRHLLHATALVHDLGYVHADLKPENIFWRDDDSATLIDFGLVTLAKPDPSAIPASALKLAIGTSEYMAPEQCQGAKELDVRTDIYALGVLVYEILSGRPPFFGPTEMVRQNQLSHRPPRLSTFAPVPPPVEDVILQCLQKRPEERFQSARDLLFAIERAFCQAVEAAATAENSAIPHSRQLRSSPSSTQNIAAASGVPSERPISTRKRIRAVLAFFESVADAATIERHLVSLGGELASVTGHRVVALFGNGCEGNPARQALLGARELIKRKICTKTRLDIASVSIQRRPNGGRRLVSPIFAQLHRFPTEEDPIGPWLSPAVTEVLNEGDVRSIALGPASVLTVRCVAPEMPTLAEADENDACFGREALLHNLVASAMDVVRGGPPSALRVIGDEGLGKTHLVGILSRRLTLAARAVRVISIAGRSSAMGEGVLADLLRAALVVPAVAPPDGGKEWLIAQLGGAGHANTWPAAALALGFLDLDAPELRGLIAAPSALRSAMTIAAGSLLRASARRCPLLVLFDDAHLADEAALAALEFATLAEAGAPIWVLAFGRPIFQESRPHWGERAERNQTYFLGPLDAHHAAKLCRKLLWPATAIPDAAIQRLVGRAQAVPMLLVELVRGLKREGIVRLRAEGQSHYLATEELDRLPDLPIVEWLADRELNSLSEDLAAHARLLAVLADEITTSEIEGILRRLDESGDTADFPLDAYASTQRLIALGVLWTSKTGAVSFRQPLVREAIAESIPDASRKRIHEVALQYYQSADRHFPEELLLSRLASHAAGAGELGFAELSLLSLAECAVSRQRYLDAEIHYTRSLALSPSPSFSTYRSRGLMRARLGRHRDAIDDFEAAQELVDAGEDPLMFAEILLDQAEALDWVDDYRSSAACVDRATALVPSEDISQLRHRLLLGKGRSLHRRCLEPESAEQLELAVLAAEAAGDKAYETLIVSLLMLGFILQGTGQLDRAAGHLDRAISLCESHGDLFYLGAALSNRALLRALVGDKEGMAEGVRRVATIARELGQVLLELASEFNLGEYLYWMNDLKGAEPHVQRAFAIEQRRSGAAMLPSVELLGARFQRYLGNHSIAADITMRLRARQAEAIAKGIGEAFLSPSDDILCSMIELSTRPATNASWDELEGRSSRYSVGQEQIEVLEMRGLSALVEGRVEEACFRLEKALALADRIPNCMRERLSVRLAEARGALAFSQPLPA